MRVGPIVSSLISEGGLLTEEKVNYVLEHQELQIVEDLFAKDALVMEHDQAHEVSLVAPDGNPYVTVAFEAPLFGIWAPKGGVAVCLYRAVVRKMRPDEFPEETGRTGVGKYSGIRGNL